MTSPKNVQLPTLLSIKVQYSHHCCLNEDGCDRLVNVALICQGFGPEFA